MQQVAFEKATTLDPANPGGWIGLARLALQQQQPARAAETLERFLSDHPGDRYAIRLLGTAYQRLGRADDAEYALALGATGEPNWPDPWSDELAQYRVGFAQNLKAATAQILNGEYTAAIPVLEKLSRERPDDLSLMHQLGLSYVAAGRAADGIALLERALSRDPDNIETHLRLASAYLNGHRLREGADARRTRGRARSRARTRVRDQGHGALARRQVRSTRSRRSRARCASIPSNVNALVWMGSILLDAGRADEALDHFATAARRNPTLGDAFVGIALVMIGASRVCRSREGSRTRGDHRRRESAHRARARTARGGAIGPRPAPMTLATEPQLHPSRSSRARLTVHHCAVACAVTILAAACGSTPAPTDSTPAAIGRDRPSLVRRESLPREASRGRTDRAMSPRYLLPEIMGGGAALFDMDGDGDLDLYLVQSGSVLKPGAKNPSNRLYRNRGDGTFEDATAGSGADVAGYGMGVAAGDYDNDGDTDLFVTNAGPNVLLRNDGSGHFTDVTADGGSRRTRLEHERRVLRRGRRRRPRSLRAPLHQLERRRRAAVLQPHRRA